MSQINLWRYELNFWFRIKVVYWFWIKFCNSFCIVFMSRLKNSTRNQTINSNLQCFLLTSKFVEKSIFKRHTKIYRLSKPKKNGTKNKIKFLTLHFAKDAKKDFGRLFSIWDTENCMHWMQLKWTKMTCNYYLRFIGQQWKNLFDSFLIGIWKVRKETGSFRLF